MDIRTHQQLLTAHSIAEMMVKCQCELSKLIKDMEPGMNRDPENSPEYKVQWNVQERLIKVTAFEYPPKLKVHPDNMNLPNRKHKTSYQVVRERWYNLIMNALQMLPHEFHLPMENVLIWISFWFPRNATIDIDNFNLKFINDAIVYSNIYTDDHFRNMMMVVRGDYDQNNPRTEVMITEKRNHMLSIHQNLLSCFS